MKHDFRIWQVRRSSAEHFAFYDAAGTGHVAPHGIPLAAVHEQINRQEAAELIEDFGELLAQFDEDDRGHFVRRVLAVFRDVTGSEMGEWTHDGATGGPLTPDEGTPVVEDNGDDEKQGLPKIVVRDGE